MANKKRNLITKWTLAGIWNESLNNRFDRPIQPRNYIYASEIGGSFCDRYLKMYGVPFSNAPTNRSKRKFTAGECWEWILGMVLIAANVFKKKQVQVNYQIKDLLPVHGRIDFIVGGAFDYDKAMDTISTMNKTLSLINLDVPLFFLDAAEKFVKNYKGKILEEVIYECKSVSSYMIEKVINSGPMPHHVCQNFHYIYGNNLNIRKGKIGYICKDDCIMQEFDISINEEIKDIYIKDIKQMTEYYNRGFDKKDPLKFLPPKEPEVLFDDTLFRFTKNWKVEYSNYLTLLYGYQSPQHYGMWKWESKISAWNNAFKRYVLAGMEIPYKNKNGEIVTRKINITDNNKEKREEAIKYFPDWDKMVEKARKAGAFLKQEETDDLDN